MPAKRWTPQEANNSQGASGDNNTTGSKLQFNTTKIHTNHPQIQKPHYKYNAKEAKKKNIPIKGVIMRRIKSARPPPVFVKKREIGWTETTTAATAIVRSNWILIIVYIFRINDHRSCGFSIIIGYSGRPPPPSTSCFLYGWAHILRKIQKISDINLKINVVFSFSWEPGC